MALSKLQLESARKLALKRHQDMLAWGYHNRPEYFLNKLLGFMSRRLPDGTFRYILEKDYEFIKDRKALRLYSKYYINLANICCLSKYANLDIDDVYIGPFHPGVLLVRISKYKNGMEINQDMINWLKWYVGKLNEYKCGDYFEIVSIKDNVVVISVSPDIRYSYDGFQ